MSYTSVIGILSLVSTSELFFLTIFFPISKVSPLLFETDSHPLFIKRQISVVVSNNYILHLVLISLSVCVVRSQSIVVQLSVSLIFCVEDYRSC